MINLISFILGFILGILCAYLYAKHQIYRAIGFFGLKTKTRKKWWEIWLIIPIILSLLIIGCHHAPEPPPFEPNPPVFYKGVSYDYCALNPNKDYRPFIDMLASYNVNMLRTFAYCGWDENFFPWDGYMGNIKPDYANRLREFISYANSKRIWVILSLFQDNAGGGTEDITSRSRGELATYVMNMVNIIRDKGVIFETINENPNREFQEWVSSELRKYGVRVSTYAISIGAEYDIHHSGNKNIDCQPGWTKYIHSTDTPSLIYLSDNDLIRIATQAKERGCHIEYAFMWGRVGHEGFLNTPQKILNEYGNVLNTLKDF